MIRRGAEKIVPDDELVSKLKESHRTGVPLRIKYGIDPTGIDVHLGHTVPMRKMRQFQELGHQAVIIIGDYTARVGDPSGRDSTRARLTGEAIEKNAATYLSQLGRVLDLSRAEVVRNGDWFAKMSFADILELCGKVTIAQLLTRDDFAKRMKLESPIFLHECLYPVMQAWDSVMVRSDIELGGTEQLYSFMLARDLQRGQNLPAQIGLMMPILVGLDGVRRMGKSLGNYIGIGEAPYEMMKKFMQVPDVCMAMYFELLTDIPLGGGENADIVQPQRGETDSGSRGDRPISRGRSCRGRRRAVGTRDRPGGRADRCARGPFAGFGARRRGDDLRHRPAQEPPTVCVDRRGHSPDRPGGRLHLPRRRKGSHRHRQADVESGRRHHCPRRQKEGRQGEIGPQRMKIGFGIVGCGMIANFHAKAIEHIRGARIAACTDTIPTSAARFAAANKCTAYASVKEMLADPAVDIVTICTPSGSHKEPAVAAANAGKHVIVEKPLEITLKRCDAIINACRKNKVLLGDDLSRRGSARPTSPSKRPLPPAASAS